MTTNWMKVRQAEMERYRKESLGRSKKEVAETKKMKERQRNEAWPPDRTGAVLRRHREERKRRRLTYNRDIQEIQKRHKARMEQIRKQQRAAQNR